MNYYIPWIKHDEMECLWITHLLGVILWLAYPVIPKQAGIVIKIFELQNLVLDGSVSLIVAELQPTMFICDIVDW